MIFQENMPKHFWFQKCFSFTQSLQTCADFNWNPCAKHLMLLKRTKNHLWFLVFLTELQTPEPFSHTHSEPNVLFTYAERMRRLSTSHMFTLVGNALDGLGDGEAPAESVLICNSDCFCIYINTNSLEQLPNCDGTREEWQMLRSADSSLPACRSDAHGTLRFNKLAEEQH